MIEELTLSRFQDVTQAIAATKERLGKLEAEQAELADQILDYCESVETDGVTRGKLRVDIEPGRRRVNWRRECQRLAKPEAIRRILANAPRVPELVVTEL